MTAKTYTLLVTITGRQPADEQALADRIAAHLEIGDKHWAPFEAALVDVFDGDAVSETPYSVRQLHAAIRKQAA